MIGHGSSRSLLWGVSSLPIFNYVPRELSVINDEFCKNMQMVMRPALVGVIYFAYGSA